MRRNRIVNILLFALLAFIARSALADAPKPNIVFIMVDDLGYADPGYQGGEAKTPNIDKLAKEGVRLESYYGQQVCTPARAAMITGRHPMRYGLQTLVIFPSHTYGLATDERTLAQALKDAGYDTWAVGKWHLGHADKKYWPQNRGFDYFYGNVVGEIDYFTHERGGVIDWQRNGVFLKEPGYITDLVGDDAVRLIDQHNDGKPFFLYFAPLAVHAPYQVPEHYADLYATAADPHRRAYLGMLTALDDQVGRIVEVLERKGIRDNTIILFQSDNGGPTSALFATGARSEAERISSGGVGLSEKPPPSNGVLRGGKGSLYEGGVRVPAIVNWPGKLKPAIVTEPVHAVDVMPTLLDLAGGHSDPDHPLDGKDIWPTLAEGRPSPHEDILINVEAFRGAIRKGSWKLVDVALLPERVELYDLASDPGERNNVADQHRDIVADLKARLVTYAKEQKPSLWMKAQLNFLGAQGKTILDPDYDIDDDGLPSEKEVLPK